MVQEKAYDLENDTIKVALLDDTVAPDKDDTTFSDTNEISGTNYTAGGATLAGSVVTQDDSGDLAKWDAADITWSTATITDARYAVIYDTTVSNDIIAYIDFGSNKSSVASDFKITWSASGITTIAQS
jgi:hypothetical protein